MSSESPANDAIETVFFDLGGVLLSNGWDEQQRASVLPKFGVSMEEYESRHEAANYFWERGLKDARWFFDQTVFYEPRSFTFEQLWADVEGQSTVLFPETYEVIAKIRRKGRYTVATLNNESRELNAYRVRAFDLRNYFDFFVCSGYVHEMKPSPDIYRSALEISGTAAAASLFIDDKEENCEAARKVGMKAIHFQSPRQLISALTENGITL